jgi:hypothetical protein
MGVSRKKRPTPFRKLLKYMKKIKSKKSSTLLKKTASICIQSMGRMLLTKKRLRIQAEKRTLRYLRRERSVLLGRDPMCDPNYLNCLRTLVAFEKLVWINFAT